MVFFMKTKDWLAFITLGLIWGSSFLWIKIAVAEVSPILLVAFRLLFGILASAVVVLVARPAFPKERKLWLALTLIGFTNNALPYVLISWGEQYIDSAVAAILNSTTPLFTMIIAHFFLHDDRLTWARLAGLLIGFAGIVVLVSRDFQPGLLGSEAGLAVLGQLAVLLASLSYAGTSVYARRTTKGLSPIIQGLVPLLGADAFMWALVGFAESPVKLPALPITWVAIIWLGVMGVCVAFLLYYYLLHSVGPTRTVLVTYVFPLVGVALGALFLNEMIDWRLLVGGGMVVGSIVLVNRGR
jgi:drug/metabolite transporter (DMT)-like permease